MSTTRIPTKFCTVSIAPPWEVDHEASIRWQRVMQHALSTLASTPEFYDAVTNAYMAGRYARIFTRIEEYQDGSLHPAFLVGEGQPIM